MYSLKHVYRALSVLILAVIIFTNHAQAQSLDDILQQAKKSLQQEVEADKAREQTFIDAEEKQQELLKAVEAEIEALQKDIVTLEGRFKENEAVIKVKNTELNEKLGQYRAMFDVARQAAGETSRTLAGSLISSQFPGRTKPISALAKAKELPTLDQVSDLWIALLKEMGEQAKVVRYGAPVIGVDGRAKDAIVTRIGPFSAVKDGQFVTYDPELSQLKDLLRQPSAKFTQSARNIESQDGGITGAAIDPSRGSILGLLVQTPSLEERVHQGGYVGYAILAVGAIGLLFALYKILTLKFVSWNVSRQQKRIDDPQNNNPLGRILRDVRQFSVNDTDAIDRKLDEVVVREIPRLESGLSFIKLLAAIAPLMGLLGTVVGMIVTFQSITLFGTGDPKLMAGGISQALVTTVLGLVTAIPLLLLHSMASGTSNRIIQILEEQAAGLIARRLESETSKG